MPPEDEIEESSLYEILGVSETATADEIKRGYFRLVRKYRPDEHPETFNRFKSAYDILGDPKRRSEYDEMRQFGSQVKSLTAEAGALMDDDPAGAVRLLKQASVLAPSLAMPRVMLGAAFLQIGEYQNAESELRRLVERDPDDAFLRCQLGRALWMLDRNQEAEQEVGRAIGIDPQYHAAYLLQAMIQRENGELAQAIASLERAIQLNGSEDFSDLDVLLRLLTIYVVEDRLDDAARTEKRIWAIVPDDEDAVHYTLASMFDLARDFHKAGNQVGAFEIIKRAQHPQLSDPDLKNTIDQARKLLALLADAQKLTADESAPKAVRAFVYFKYLAEYDEDAADHDMEALMDNALNEVGHVVETNPVASRNFIVQVRRTYPHLYDDLEEFFQALDRHALSLSASRAPQSTGTGCGVLMALCLGIALLLLVIICRAGVSPTLAASFTLPTALSAASRH